ncbi:MAG: winged helix DNA-binding domain-containing protein [Actinomycetota bacterium]
MVERTLTARELNRALLARQLLLERAELPIPRALERVGGLQTQYAPSAYIALWSRVAGFERDALTRALERRSVVQATLMRVTIHMVSRRDYPLFAEGVREGRREQWLKVTRRQADARTVAAAAHSARKLLADGPPRRSELVEHLGVDNVTWNGIGLWVDLVRVPPSGTWEQRRADLYAAADDWLGPSEATPEQGLEHLVRRYLGGFGPASLKDVASWVGLPVSRLAPVLERLRLRRFRDERGEELLDLPRAPLPDADMAAPVRFLPTWDATLLVHARRTQILPERFRPRVFDTKTPHSAPTFLVDGRVAGTWKHKGGRVQLEPFEHLPREARRDLAEEAEHLAAFLA